MICFLDEFGNSGLDFSKTDVSTHFIITGILVEDKNIETTEKEIIKISKEYFSGGEIKSKNVAANDARRINILELLLKLEINIFSLVVDKREISSKGLKYKRSFHKFLNRIAYDRLFLTYPGINLISDEHGSKDFMNGFSQYIENRSLKSELFNSSTFQFRNSKDNSIIQAADFIGGTIARCFDQTVLSDKRSIFIQMLANSQKLFPIVEWPPRYKPYSESKDISEKAEFDNQIRTFSLRSAKAYIDAHRNSNENNERVKTIALQVMMFNALYGDANRFISTGELIKRIQSISPVRINKESFGRTIVGKLRDSDVMIVSNTVGYKIIVNAKDLLQFVKYFNNFIGPMISRLRRYRNNTLRVTGNKFDIIENPAYAYLEKLL